MPGLTLYCCLCGEGTDTVGEVPVPQPCAHCRRETVWSTMPPHASGPPLPLNHNDRRFLRGIRIAQE